MAMKVNKTAIHRLSVNMSCGCKMYAEFEDAQCKVCITPWNEAEETLPRVFVPCARHATDASVAMLEFIIGERLDEAVEDAQKSPIAPLHLHSLPQIEEGDSGGVQVGAGSTAQVVQKVNKPVAVRPRPQAPPGIKPLVRSPEQLAKVGSVTASGAAEMQIDEVAEDEEVTPHIDDLMDSLYKEEAGLFNDED